MVLEKIITQASPPVKLPFLAMVRSLRASGCNLPVWVIPYDDSRFDLPSGCSWWENQTFSDWLSSQTRPGHSSSVMRKYQCLLEGGYIFVDSDVVFLRNPADVLRDQSGFVTSCLHWSNPAHTYTPQSLNIFRARTTLWAASVFNSGQFASDLPLYSFDRLMQVATAGENRETVLDYPYHEQPGMNLLVHLSSVHVTNLTLPPSCMESTWAGDYDSIPVEKWSKSATRPLLIHWAGTKPEGVRQIDELFFNFLSPEERQQWLETRACASTRGAAGSLVHRLKKALNAARSAWKVAG